MKPIVLSLLLIAFASIVISMQSKQLTKADLQVKGAEIGTREDDVSIGYSNGTSHFQNGYFRYYGKVLVFYDTTGTVTGVMFTGPGHSTFRGLHVGDVADRALQLYGQPAERSPSEKEKHDLSWSYYYPPDTTFGLTVGFSWMNSQVCDTIRTIYVGKFDQD